MQSEVFVMGGSNFGKLKYITNISKSGQNDVFVKYLQRINECLETVQSRSK